MPYGECVTRGEWRKEWKEMPEFESTNKRAVRVINIHFRTEEDIKSFEDLFGQKIRPKRKYYWYPEKEPQLRTEEFVWVHESQLPIPFLEKHE